MSSEPIDGRATFDFDGRVALVTGASQGIGADIAGAFAAAGAAVVLGARNLDRLRAVADHLDRRFGGRVVPVRADVREPEAAETLVRTALTEFGRLDFAVNNAADGPMPAPLAEVSLDGFDLGIETNLRGTFLGMKAQIPAMLTTGGGAIVNLASVAGLSGFTNLGPYVAGKAGIIGLSKVAALDYADQGIRINVVAPGPIRTGGIIAAGERAQELAAAAVPMHRMGEPADVSDVVLWLCSDRSRYVTGAVIPVDGGQAAGSKPDRMYRPGEAMD